MEEYFCPHCGATLNNQVGFDPNNGVWECTQCGQELFGDEVAETQQRFEGVVWRCDNCDAILNLQPGFHDFLDSWICNECGYENELSEENIIDYQVRPVGRLEKAVYRLERFNRFLERVNQKLDQKSTTADLQDDNADLDDDYSDPQDNVECDAADVNIENESLQQHFTPQILEDRVKRPSLSKQIWHHITRKKFKTKKSSAEWIGQDIRVVYSEILTCGFYNIEIIAEEDLEIDDLQKEGTVDYIVINGDSSFEASSSFPFNAEVIIQYHTLKTVRPPFAPKQAKGKHYQKVVAAFVNAGFFNVETRAIHDLTFGWITKDGAVEGIQIERKCDFSAKTKYRLDADIVISYHTFRRKG